METDVEPQGIRPFRNGAVVRAGRDQVAVLAVSRRRERPAGDRRDIARHIPILVARGVRRHERLALEAAVGDEGGRINAANRRDQGTDREDENA
jgi:hypothetical protein